MKLRRLDVARGFAASYVVAHHVIPHDLAVIGLNVGAAFRFGQEAVILFFLLSGFVIHYAHQQHNDRSARRFYFDRATRIYIPLLAVFVLSYLTESLVAGALINPRIPTLLGNIFMLQDVNTQPGVLVSPYMHNTPLWSLSYEWWFYIAYYPLVTMRMSWGSKCRIVQIASVAAAIVYIWLPFFPIRVIMYMLIWWSGASLANFYLEKQRIEPKDIARVSWPLAAVTLILLFNVVYIGGFRFDHLGTHPVLEARHFFTAIVILVFSIAWQRLNWVAFELLSPFHLVAPFSYGLYIAHSPILALAPLLGPSLALRIVILGILLVLVASLLERSLYPAIKSALRRRFFTRDLLVVR